MRVTLSGAPCAAGPLTDPPSAHAQQADDWKACGGQVHDCLQRCVSRLAMDDASTAVWDDLSSVWTAAEDAINGAHHSKVQRKWRRVYTDACMLKAVAALVGAHDSDSMCQPVLLDAIRGLDMAIVVCGAPGNKRLETIHGGIASLQSQLPPLARPASVAPPRECVGEASPDEPFCLASGTIKETDTLPSLSEYLRVCHSEPFIVRSHGADWPALQDGKRAWSDVGYLEQVAGPGRVVPVEIGWQYTDSDWHQAIIPWAEFLQESGWSGSSSPEEQRSREDKPPTYLAQHNLFDQFPALEADLVVPDIVYSCPSAPAYHEQYRPPRDDEGMETTIINAWFGPAGTLTPVHFDPYYNAYGMSEERVRRYALRSLLILPSCSPSSRLKGRLDIPARCARNAPAS